MKVTDKDISSKKNLLGQFLTPIQVAEFCLSKIEIKEHTVIEPSCGTGAFLDLIPETKEIIGIEYDETMINNYKGKHKIIMNNFYDFNCTNKSICFIGNPPYHSPALSLTEKPDVVKTLRKKYNIPGMREEAVFFILKTYEIIKTNGEGTAHYILPKSIFKNNSKSFIAFRNFLKNNFPVFSVWELEKCFQNVTRNLLWVSFGEQKEFTLNGIPDSSWLEDEPDIIPFQKIFKKTYLGSVPCEGLFLSNKQEPKEEFRNRLVNLFSEENNKHNFIKNISYEGKIHLRALRKLDENKIKVFMEYVQQTKETKGYDIQLFQDLNNYKVMFHRDDERFYFRHEFLKKAKFLYQLNPNPCKSFTFPGNPSSSSKDYFEIVEYDVNRNSGPGAQRTIPLDNIENNLTDYFKEYWQKNCGHPYQDVVKYIKHISNSEWYKNTKKNYERFYFGVPKTFDTTFNPNTVTIEK